MVAQLQPAPHPPVLLLNRGCRLDVQSLNSATNKVSLKFNARIQQIIPIRPHGQPCDWIMIVTADLEMAVLDWNPEHGWRTICKSDLRDRAVRPVENMLCAQESRLVLLHTAHGQLKVIPLKGGEVREAFNVRIEQLRVLSLAIMSTPADQRDRDRPVTVALLHIPAIQFHSTSQPVRHLSTVTIHRDRTCQPGDWSITEGLDPTAHLLIAHPAGGLIVVGRQEIAWHQGGESKHVNVPTGVGLIQHYTLIDQQSGQRILLTDDQARLYLLIVAPTGLRLEPLGQVIRENAYFL